jgi:phosphoglycolate phosphatase
MKKLRNIFFDLDGTLVDTRLGVFRCYRYAFEKLGLPCPDDSELLSCLGPPLREAFARFLDTKDNTSIEKAVAIYRERYGQVGVLECEPYAGIPELLAGLHEEGFYLYVVTTKAKPYADTIADKFGFSPLLEGVYGTGMDGWLDDKTEMVRHILETRDLKRDETVIIGDRERDIKAGKDNGIFTIGVTYGYGSRDEITKANPDWICGSPEEIRTLLTGGNDTNRSLKGSLSRYATKVDKDWDEIREQAWTDAIQSEADQYRPDGSTPDIDLHSS